MVKSSLLSSVQTEIRRRNYSPRTESAYVGSIKQYVKFNDLQHPQNLSEKHVVKYLSYLANKRSVAASTQNQALCAILFLYDKVLNQPLDDLSGFDRAKKPKKLPVVMSKGEVRTVLGLISGIPKLVCALCISECLRLRVKDIDFDYHQIQVRSGKGRKDCITMLPDFCTKALKKQMRRVKILHAKGLKKGYGKSLMPNALAKKYPSAARSFK